MAKLLDGLISVEGRREWRSHWPVVASAMVALAIGHIHLVSMGIMIPHLEGEFGWSRSQITASFLIISLVGFSLSPVLGIVIDKIGSRRVALGGVMLYSSAVALLALTPGSIWIWWAQWFLVAMGSTLLNPTVWVTAISSHFSQSRGVAIAGVLSATGAMAFLGPIATVMLVDQFGWRGGYAVWGSIGLLLAFPPLYFWFFSAKDPNKLRPPTAGPVHNTLTTGPSLSEQIRSKAFIKLATAGPIMSLIFIGFVVNSVPILKEGGLSTVGAASIAGLVGVSQIIGRLASGFLVDRFNARYVGAIVVWFPIFTALILILAGGSTIAAAIAVLLFGFAVGAEVDALAYLCSRHFGLSRLGSIFGVLMGLTVLGAGVGPMLASLIYDTFGSYRTVLFAIVPICLLASYSFLTLGPYPESSGETDAASARKLP